MLHENQVVYCSKSTYRVIDLQITVVATIVFFVANSWSSSQM